MEENKNLEMNDIQKVDNQSQQKTEKNEQKKATREKTKKARKWIVLAFLVLTLMVLYVIYRGEYLETLELGSQYLSVFWQNITYRFVTFGVNFFVLYFLISSTRVGSR